MKESFVPERGAKEMKRGGRKYLQDTKTPSVTVFSQRQRIAR